MAPPALETKRAGLFAWLGTPVAAQDPADEKPVKTGARLHERAPLRMKNERIRLFRGRETAILRIGRTECASGGNSQR